MDLQLRRLRKSKGYTQGELAESINTTRRVVGAYERQETPIPLDVAYDIAVLLGVTLDELAGLPVPKRTYSDRQQERLNQCYEEVNDKGKKQIAEAAENCYQNKSNRIQKDRQIPGVSAVGA